MSNAVARVRTLVVDDEPLARSSLMVLLRLDPEIEVVGECGGGSEALAAFRSSRPELVFLDVEMPDFDGFNVLAQLGSDVPPVVIFVTAYDTYAVRAFEAGARDYLLKPFDDARFERALERAKQQLALGRSTPKKSAALVIKNAGEVTFIRFAEIDWIEADDYYSRVHSGAKTHLLRRSLTDLARELNHNQFCRIHRSAIVRLDAVRGLRLNESGEYDVLLDDGTMLRLSRRYRQELQSRLNVRQQRAVRVFACPDHAD